jgi:phage tail-like protein
MNDEETKYFVINTENLWQEGEQLENLQVTGDGLSLAKSSDYSYVDTFVPGAVIPQSLDRDFCGVLYILGEQEKSIMVYDIRSRYSRWLECLSLKRPVSIAVSDTDIYIVDKGDDFDDDDNDDHNNHDNHDNDDNHDIPVDEFTGNWTLYCLARVNLQTRWVRQIGKDARIATAGKGYLYVLDLNGKKLYKLGRTGNAGNIKLTDANGAVYSLEAPTDIASDRQGFFYILEGQKKEILAFDQDGLFIETFSIHFKEEAHYLSLALENSDNIFLGFEDRSVHGQEIKTADNCGVVHLSKDIKYDVYGTYFSKVFDSAEGGCVWHRAVLEADIPANTRFTLSYAAADFEPAVNAQFIDEPLPNPRDTLLNGACGRYIRFKLELFSDETCSTTPLLKHFKVYFPRLTYLRYLPGTFQEDEKKREFLERFLSLFETFMSAVEDQVDRFTRYLDTAAVPGGFIPWLSSWLTITQDENWPMGKKRLLLQQAPGLYKIRGTPRALSQMIELFYDMVPIIIEPFQFKCIDFDNSDENSNEDNDEKCNKKYSYPELVKILYGIDPREGIGSYRFTVLVPPKWEEPAGPLKKAKEATETQRITLQRIMDTEKPANTTGSLQVLEPWFYLDMHTYLGINTVLTKTEFVLEKSSVLGRDTVIYDKEQAGQVGRKSRIGMDFNLS